MEKGGGANPLPLTFCSVRHRDNFPALVVAAAAAHLVELHELAANDVIPELPSRFLCREDCKGLCPVCGCDRNVTQCGCEEKPASKRWSGACSCGPWSFFSWVLPFSAPPFLDCKGLCPVCGCDRNVTQCGCEEKQLDPRLAALDNMEPPPIAVTKREKGQNGPLPHSVTNIIIVFWRPFVKGNPAQFGALFSAGK